MTRKPKLTPKAAAAKRDSNIARYMAFMVAFIDEGHGTHIDMHATQHDDPSDFYAVFRINTDVTYERLLTLLDLVSEHDGKLHVNLTHPGRGIEVYLGSDA